MQGALSDYPEFWKGSGGLFAGDGEEPAIPASRTVTKPFLSRLRAHYFSRKITSPWPTIWSFNHTRYLYVPAFVPTRGGPLRSRIPNGA